MASLEVTKLYITAQRIGFHGSYISEKLRKVYVCAINVTSAYVLDPHIFFLGTPRENLLDMRRKNRHWHKISKKDVLKIRRLAEFKIKSNRKIAKQFNLSHTMVNDIVRRVWWK